MSDSIEKLRAAEARLIIAAPQPRQMTPDEREWRIEREIDCIRAGLAASRSDAAEAWKLRALEAEAKPAALVEAIDAEHTFVRTPRTDAALGAARSLL